MLTIEQIRLLLLDRRLAAVAKSTGLHVNTLLKVRKEGSNPTIKTLTKISDYLEQPVK